MIKRSFRHWNLKYILSRIKDIIYQKLNPSDPWLTPDSIKLIKKLIKEDDKILEFGSGRSTIWFSKYSQLVYSIETNLIWYHKIKKVINNKSIKNVKLFLLEEKKGNFDQKYSNFLKSMKQDFFDIILVDGKHRDITTRKSMKVLKSGGLLIIDNVNRYMLSASRSPNSLKKTGKHLNGEWKRIEKDLKKWRCIWTSNGVTDTAIFFKP